MAKYQKYAEYQDSGVEWLGNIPSHWIPTRLKNILQERNEKNDPIQSRNILSLTMHQGVIPHGEKIGAGGNKPKEDLTAYKLVHVNDIVLNSMNVIVGSVGLSKYFGVVSLVYYMLYPRNKINTDIKFYNYIFQSKAFQENLGRLGTGILIKKSESSGKLNTIRMKISMDDLNNELLIFPPFDEQTQIANFLDHETAKIDTLIAKQEKLIELLKEKRQAVISHAVTKGLNPNVPMKDSGVEWLGEVPEHWQIGRVKDLALVISKGTTPSTMGGDFVDDGIRFVKAENIGKRFDVKPTPEFFITEQVDEQLSRSRLQESDVLVIIAGATTGLASVLQKDLLPANTNQAVSFVRLKNVKYSQWLAFWLTTKFAQSTIWMGAVQSAQPNLSMESLGNITLPIPYPEEVEIILEKIHLELQTFDLLIEKAKSAIQLMQERRTALISSAVTGKIDVRNWQHPNQKNNNKELSA